LLSVLTLRKSTDNCRLMKILSGIAGIVCMGASVVATAGCSSEPSPATSGDGGDTSSTATSSGGTGGSSSATSSSGTGCTGTLGFFGVSSPSVGMHPNAVATADLNGDGKPDLVTGNHTSHNVSVLLACLP
jgi:hypothetical protein